MRISLGLLNKCFYIDNLFAVKMKYIFVKTFRKGIQHFLHENGKHYVKQWLSYCFPETNLNSLWSEAFGNYIFICEGRNIACGSLFSGLSSEIMQDSSIVLDGFFFFFL